MFALTHHAMLRLAQRCEVRTPDDLLAAIKEIWLCLKRRVLDEGGASLPRVFSLPLPSGIAIVERTKKHGPIIKTVLDTAMTLEKTP